MTTYNLTSSIPTTVKTGDILNCPYSGAMKSITLPKGTYTLEVWGAQGGYRSSTSYGGLGGYSKGTLSLSSKTTLYLYAGGAGNTVTTATSSIYPGGFNGGGYRYAFKGGGGASDIRIGQDSLYARVIVAGGGGSDGASSRGGSYGGGTTGGTTTQSFYTTYCGYGGTQTGNASGYLNTTQGTSNSSSDCPAGFGFGGMGTYRSSGYGGAGGGGWYGGQGTYPDGSGDDDCGGGGGSGYVYTSSTVGNYPSGCLLNSSYYLSDASTVAGNTSFIDPDSGSSVTGRTGNGYVRITVVEAQSLECFVNINGSWKNVDSLFVNIGGTWKQVEELKSNISGTWK